MTARSVGKAAGWWSLLLFGWVALIGCGTKEVIPVSGRVYLDDKPLDGGTITFHPVRGGPPGIGVIDSSGRFKVMTGQAAGLKPGEYIVTVVKKSEPPQGAAVNNPYAMPPLELLTPKIYADPKNSPLRYTVPSNQPAEFKLSSKQ